MSVGKTIGLIKSNLKTKISWRKTPFGGITRTISWCRRWGSPIPEVHCTGNQIFKSHQKPVDREWKSEVLGKNIESQDCQIFPSIFVADRSVLLRGSEDDREWNFSTPSVSHANKWSEGHCCDTPQTARPAYNNHQFLGKLSFSTDHSVEYKLRRKCTNG